ncbi:MAG: hypothetical protein FWE94_06475 [Coriobacteriia bacterium]|nr:hypothetical protein [Coriobacteriia bacterium]
MADTKPSFAPGDDQVVVARKAVDSSAVLSDVVGALSGEDRRARQFAASVVHEIADHDPALLKPFVDELADALHRPESQTRWEVLGTFEELVGVDARLVDKALTGTEAALHDEESGVVRLAAFRLLVAYGATTARRSERAWSLVSESLRCYHGDPEFLPMLDGIYKMVCGNASDKVKRSAAEAMAFDAENAKGTLKRRALRIVACAPSKSGK